MALCLHKEEGKGNGGSDLRFKPNLISYATLIHGLCEEGLLDKGKQLFLEMKGKGIRPDLITYSGLIHGLCEGDRGHKRDVVSYNVLISGYGKIHKLEEAMRLFKEMVSEVYKLDVITFNTLLTGLFHFGDVKDARTLF
ncbi:unnamed protein product [Fraxinus pennsylvanica]|uniref:Pentatricopeptide repeat-containing protein n=1 Tax=Fraxinus pennsylvanica TaxID=56036 RepID=A0AAD2ACM0_9LAMI|nr:unnamed protein product [Fraxinus pennsylvanica]